MMTALKAGVALSSVRRPLMDTKVICERPGQKDEADGSQEAITAKK